MSDQITAECLRKLDDELDALRTQVDRIIGAVRAMQVIASIVAAGLTTVAGYTVGTTIRNEQQIEVLERDVVGGDQGSIVERMARIEARTESIERVLRRLDDAITRQRAVGAEMGDDR